MTILLTGGGTGGHITPLLAVAHELKKQQPDCRIVYIGERKGKFAHLLAENPAINDVYTIFAGKYRRYHSTSPLAKLLDIKTIILNVRDIFYLCIGLLQSLLLVRRLKPDVVLLKGGFVGVPVGLSAAFWHVPIITHDSDAMPGLANRLVSRWAIINATALPSSYYRYPAGKVRQVGVIVDRAYAPATEKTQADFKIAIGVSPDQPLLLITGASSGAQAINKAVRTFVDTLLHQNPKLYIVHQVGKGKAGVYEDYRHERLQVHEFLTAMHQYTGAADLVVARASGNTMAELGIQGKACIAVPSPYLAGGHQLKNAELLIRHDAAEVVPEDKLYDPKAGLLAVINKLLTNEIRRAELGRNLQALTVPDAARKLAGLLLEVAEQR